MYNMRVDMEDFDDNTAFALYKTFSIASSIKYRLEQLVMPSATTQESSLQL